MRTLLAATLALLMPLAAFGQAADVYNPADPIVSNPPTSPAGPQLPLGSALYDNGPFVTGTGNGPGGSDLSVLQGNLGMTIFGFGNQQTAGNRMADQFVVTDPTGWRIDQAVFYSYQTGSTTTSTIDSVSVRIYDGPPNDVNSNVVFGDTTTNRFVSTSWTGAYRVTDTTLTNTQRPIMASIANLGGLELPPGTYWLDWSIGGTLASGPWQIPITIIGQTNTGDALQFTSASMAWAPAVDGTFPQGAPFTLLGEVIALPGVLTLSAANLNFGNVALGATGSSTLTVSNTGTGPLNVTSITGPASPFSITGGTCGATPFTLAAGASCTLVIGFAPGTVGSFNGSLTLNTDVPSSATVTLAGAGAVPPPAFIPTSSGLSLLLMLGLLALVGFFALRRRAV